METQRRGGRDITRPTASYAHPHPPPVDSHPYPPPSAAAYTHHEVHVVGSGGVGGEQHHSFHRSHIPGFIADHIHNHHGHQSEGGPIPEFASRPSVRVFTKAETNSMLAIRDGKVILARSNPNDSTQRVMVRTKGGKVIPTPSSKIGRVSHLSKIRRANQFSKMGLLRHMDDTLAASADWKRLLPSRGCHQKLLSF